MVQGDIPSGAFFSVAMQPSLLRLDQECQQGGGLARAGFDDVYAVGRPEVVLQAVLRLQVDLRDRCGLSLQWSKTEWFNWRGPLPANAPPGLKLAGVSVDNIFHRGLMCYGIPLGSNEHISHQLQEKAQEIAEDAKRTVPSGDRQALWSVLRLSS